MELGVKSAQVELVEGRLQFNFFKHKAVVSALVRLRPVLDEGT